MTAFGKALEPAYRSKLERDYAAVLDAQRAAGEIRAWWFEDVALRIGHDCRLHIDFMVQLPDLSIEFHEAKGGFQREDSIAKLRAAASKFPFVFRLVTRSKAGAWEIREVGQPRKSVPRSAEQCARTPHRSGTTSLRAEAGTSAESVPTVERVATVLRAKAVEVPGTAAGGTTAARKPRTALLNGKPIAMADALKMVRG